MATLGTSRTNQGSGPETRLYPRTDQHPRLGRGPDPFPWLIINQDEMKEVKTSLQQLQDKETVERQNKDRQRRKIANCTRPHSAAVLATNLFSVRLKT